METDVLTVLHGDALTQLKTLESESIQMCVTSPPYWGLRDYRTAPIVWPDTSLHPKGSGSDETTTCSHEWITTRQYKDSPTRSGSEGVGFDDSETTKAQRWREHDLCRLCGAWRGSLGLEPSPDFYVQHVVQIFREVRRVLRSDGTLWLNLGDSYATGGGTVGRSPGGGDQGERFLRAGMINTQPNRMPLEGLKPKDLIGIPWRVALALQSEGWYLRSEITWCKRAPMPESVTDRPTSATEKIFLLSKSEKYLYNRDEVRLSPLDAEDDARRILYRTLDGQKSNPTETQNGLRPRKPFGPTLEGGEYGRHHLGDAIPEKQRRSDRQRGHSRRHAGFNDRWDLMTKAEQLAGGANLRNYWVLSPDPFPDAHFATFPREIPKRCILLGSNASDAVLDCFAGSGTAGKVAIELGRKAILIEPKAEYVEMIERRCKTTIGLPL